jgi:leucyl/phenylalanyl-tRNA--protein transferase
VAVRFPPLEPAPTEVRFPDPRKLAPGDPVVAIGADFRPGTLLSAYRRGIFPWPQSRRVVAWCSMDPRAIFPLDHAPEFSRSLRRALRKSPWTVRVDHDFRGTMVACGANRPEGTWILPSLVTGYVQMHELGWAHSVEVYEGEELVGGIYGIAVGALFAGESMFHTKTDASKVAFAHLATRLYSSGFQVFDVQVMNPHLESLGCVDLSRDAYLDLAARAVAEPARPLPEALVTSSW